MYIVKAEANQVEKIVEMSIRAFETDVNVGGAKGDCPPGFDSVEWHKQMAREGHLYQAMIDNDLVGAAILFPDETKNSVYIGRIFIDSIYHRKGYGIHLMECIEKNFPCAAEFDLNTPSWNERTNAFYKRLGYHIIKVEDGFVFYQKKNRKSEQTQRQISSPNGRQKQERNIIMPKEIAPKYSPRATAYELWMKAPNPMVTFFKTLDVTNLLTVSRKKNMKFNMLLCFCIAKAAVGIEEFYTLPVGKKLLQYDKIAVSIIVKNKLEKINSCDISYAADLETFNQSYLENTSWVAENCDNKDLSGNSMVIGTSAIIETELDGVIGMNSGIFNNPFISWGRYRKKDLRYEMPISFQFHHTQMDGSHAGSFLENLQNEINLLQ